MDALVGYAHFAPVAVGLLVVEVDGGVQALGVELVDLREELPCHGDGVALEVVAEREVAHHLEGGAVAEVPHGFDVGRAETALHGDRAVRGRRLLAEEVGLELLHPGAGEQRCRIADGHERPRGQEGVAPVLEELDVGVANFVGGARGLGHGLRMVREEGRREQGGGRRVAASLDTGSAGFASMTIGRVASAMCADSEPPERSHLRVVMNGPVFAWARSCVP
jgi:hypothetical protein